MLTLCRSERRGPQSQEEQRGGRLWVFLLTAYFNTYSVSEGMAERNTSSGRALLLRQNCKEGPGGQILLFLVLMLVRLFPLKKAKLKWPQAGPVTGKRLEGSDFRHTFADMGESCREGFQNPKMGEMELRNRKCSFHGL